MSLQRMIKSKLKFINLSLFSIFMSVSLIYVLYGRIFLDSGFYLNSALEICSGQLPYKDFFYVQGPIYPYVYGFIFKFIPISVLSGRLISFLFGLGTIWISGLIAEKWSGSKAFTLAVAMCSLSALHAYYFISIKLYSLTAFFLTLSVFLFILEKNKKITYSLAAVFAILAAATRLTLAPAVIIFIAMILLKCYRERNFAALGMTFFTSVLLASSIAIPFLIIDQEAVLYNLIKIHVSASSGPYLFGISNKAKVLLKIMASYPIFPLSLFLIMCNVHFRKLTKDSLTAFLRDYYSEITTFLIIVAVTCVHLTANWFSAGYQSVVMPLTGSLVAVWVSKIDSKVIKNKLFRMVAIGIIVGTFFGFGQTPIWKGNGTALSNINNVSQILKGVVKSNSPVAACSAVIPIQVGLKIAKPFGGAPFTFTPEWDREKCERFGGINSEMLIDRIQSRQYGALVFEKNSFSIGFPGFFSVKQEVQNQINAAIDEYYNCVAVLPNFGDGEMTLNVYTPKLSDPLESGW